MVQKFNVGSTRFHESLHNPFRRFSVPKWRDLSQFCFAIQGFLDVGRKPIRARQSVASECDRDRPFGVGTQGQTRRSKIGALFLQPAGISQHQPGVFSQANGIMITHRLENFHGSVGDRGNAELRPHWKAGAASHRRTLFFASRGFSKSRCFSPVADWRPAHQSSRCRPA
jgi:hypothetical protein